ncbi:MAG: tRNA lysidine(34) synthetase TilS [Actinomycetota bacterium]|nr:tRNA lysidine(34) synthetase TilS [Actinomycetota bacterium]
MTRKLGDPTFGGPGYKVVEQALAAVTRYGMLDAGDSVLVAFSGGPDSTCMLDVLARLRGKLGLKIAVAHVDHGLSDASAEIAAKVSTAVAEAGFEIHVVRIPDLEGPNLHARARDFRYGFLDLVVDNEKVERIATGHTLDDRAETTLARLVHGAGTAGLAGIPPIEGKRVRPLIDIRRAETREYCIECGLDFHEDPANEDPRFERPAVRARLIPEIEERWGPGAIRAIAQSSERLREDATALAQLAERLYTDIAKVEANTVRFASEALLSMPRAFRRRVLELAVGRVRDRSAGIDEVLAALDRSSTPSKDASFSIAGGIEISTSATEIVVRKPETADD